MPPGAITSVSTIARDITSRKKAETSLRDERDRAQQYLDTAEVILLKLDVEGRIRLVNRYACTVLGWTADELLGRDWIETCLPSRMRDDTPRTRSTTWSAAICRLSRTLSSPGLATNGSSSGATRVLRDDAGQVIGTFSSGTDITERNQAVEALRTGGRADAVCAARRRRRDLGHGLRDQACCDGPRSSKRSTACEPGTFGGTFEAFVERVHPDDRESVLETVGKAMKSGGDFSILHRTICPDGTVRWLSGAGRVLLGEHGEPVRGVGISLDVTERHTLEAAVSAGAEDGSHRTAGRRRGPRLQQSADRHSGVLRAVAGRISTPDDPRQADITEIQKAGARAAGLTRQLLAFSRKEIIQPTLLDLNVDRGRHAGDARHASSGKT